LGIKKQIRLFRMLLPLFVTEFGNIKFLYGRQKTPTVKKFIKHWQLELPEMAKVELRGKQIFANRSSYYLEY
ncbi:MAG: hypothetical protein ACJATF_002760, partial [Flavobacteriales bacterium]